MKIGVILSLWVALAWVNQAEACSCAPKPEVKQALKDAASVFAGRVESIRAATGQNNPFGSVEVTLRVLETWKGATSSKTIRVFTSRNSAACGYRFFKGESYLVYSYPFQKGALSTNLCTRTKSLDQAYDDLEKLGPGKSPKG